MRQFERGDHLRVRRFGYDHHGIYMPDARVIDFSGGPGAGDVTYCARMFAKGWPKGDTDPKRAGQKAYDE
jgi:Lecithin retinol acyltransferase